MADIKYQNRTFALTTAAATNTQDVTISGFGTVKAALVFISGGVVDDTVVGDTIYGVGMASATAQACMTMTCEDNVSPSNTNSSYSDASFIYMPDPAAVVTLGADFTVEFIADGIRLTVVDASPTAYLCTLVLIGGADVLNADIQLGNMGTGTTPVTISGFGGGSPFVPSHVFAITSNENAIPGTYSRGTMGFGTSDFVANRGTFLHARENSVGARNEMYMADDALAGNTFNSNLTWKGAASNPQSGSFDITPISSSFSTNVIALALEYANSPSIDIFSTTMPAVGNVNEETPGYEPSFAMVSYLTGPPAAYNAITTADAANNLVSFDGILIGTIYAGLEDADTPNIYKSGYNDSLKSYTTPGTGTEFEGTMAFDALGFNMALTTNPATDDIGWAVTVEIGTAGAPVLSNPTTPVYTP